MFVEFAAKRIGYLSANCVLIVQLRYRLRNNNNSNGRKVNTMKNGGKESSKASTGIKRVSDLIPEGSREPLYPTLKDIMDVDLEIISIKVQYGRSDNVRYILVTVILKGKEIVVQVTQRKVIAKLLQLQEQLPLVAKFIKGARVWDVV